MGAVVAQSSGELPAKLSQAEKLHSDMSVATGDMQVAAVSRGSL